MDVSKFNDLETVVDILANKFTGAEREAIFKIDFENIEGLHGQELKKRLSKSHVIDQSAIWGGGPT